MHRTVLQLPTGPEPGWELHASRGEGLDLKSVAESQVVLQSLRQCKRLHRGYIFPRFSVKTRGSKAAEVTPPPHTTKAHGKFDLHVGPHVFANTAIFEVHYLPTTPSAVTGGSQASPQHSNIPSASTSGVQSSLSSVAFPSGTYVTPALSAKVTNAAQTDPVLANLLNAVINRTANEQQVKTLGYLIQSLDNVPSIGSPASADPGTAALPAQPFSSPRPFDIVLEYYEKPGERFILPRGDVVCDLAAPKAPSIYRSSDLIITHCLPFPGATSSADTSEREVVSLRFSRVSQSLWELLSAWAGGPEMIDQSRLKLIEIAKASTRSFLQHRLPEGELLDEIRSAVAPPFTMKPIKPAGADSNRSKRKSVSRRPTIPVVSSPRPNEVPPPVKRRSQPKAKASLPPPIACHSCGQTDVPLMMGGRYCRECINAGKAVADIPQLQPSRAVGGIASPQTPGPSHSHPVPSPSIPAPYMSAAGPYAHAPFYRDHS
ncbi:hypothetical protein GY45DRAFT_998593 [Cubamyces sp. BRFM 1775]|nr:hypothetical protein GY45DRAFT_998593 [Cubamyces sp. BRFM 1775]